MDIIDALLLGLVQGIAEWLPISSSGHLAIVHRLLDLAPSPAFDVALHAGTILAVLAIYYKDIITMIEAVIRLDQKSPAWKIAVMLMIATVPAAVLGVLFNDFFESLFGSIQMIGIALIINAAILFVGSSMKGWKKDIDAKDAAIIGIAQAAAIAPGISRSGSTISAGIIAGVDKEKAAYFSFLLSLPITMGAAIFEIRKANLLELAPETTIAGILASFIVGYASIKLLIKMVKESKFHYFAAYCLLAGLACLFLL